MKRLPDDLIDSDDDYSSLFCETSDDNEEEKE